MTKDTFEATKETILDKWAQAHGEATPADMFGAAAVYQMPAWIQSQIGPKPRVTKMEHYEITKAITERARGLQRARRMLEGPPLGGFQPGQEC